MGVTSLKSRCGGNTLFNPPLRKVAEPPCPASTTFLGFHVNL